MQQLSPVDLIRSDTAPEVSDNVWRNAQLPRWRCRGICASCRQRPGTLPNSLQCAGQLLTRTNHPAAMFTALRLAEAASFTKMSTISSRGKRKAILDGRKIKKPLSQTQLSTATYCL